MRSTIHRNYKENYLIAHHYLPCDGLFIPNTEKYSIYNAFLDKIRDSFDGQRHHHDRWKTFFDFAAARGLKPPTLDRWKKISQKITGIWIGIICFNIIPIYRREAIKQFYTASSSHQTMARSMKLKEEIKCSSSLRSNNNNWNHS